jgi:cell division topological specificity factor
MSISNQLTKILHYFQRPEKSAKFAKERLQIIIAHERGEQGKPDYLANLQQDIIDVIAKYVNIDKNQVKVELERKDGCSILELNVMLPNFHQVDAENEQTEVHA